MFQPKANQSSSPGRLVLVGLLIWIAGATTVFGGGIAIIGTEMADNGDDDGFADTNETVSLRLTLENTSGVDLTGVTATVSTFDSDRVCLTQSTISVGDLAAGQTLTTTEALVFRVAPIDRVSLGLDAFADLSATFHVSFDALPIAPPAVPSVLSFDLDLDVIGGSDPSPFFESFEGGGLGAFEVDPLDSGRSSLAGSDGYRCQYNDPDLDGSNTNGTSFAATCFLGVSATHADQIYWSPSGPSDPAGRSYTGVGSMYFGSTITASAGLGQTLPTATLEAARTSAPIYLDWNGTSAQLSFKHQASFIDGRSITNVTPGETIDRAVVMVQVADTDDLGIGPWFKIYPYMNGYDQLATNDFSACSFDPTDDGSAEDDLFNPFDPLHKVGPSSTCYPEPVFAYIGDTDAPFDALNVGNADGPGLQGALGDGTWVESRFDLGRFKGRRVRVRFLASTLKPASFGETWQEVFNWNPDPGDDGWWIDDVLVEGRLMQAADVTVDTKPNDSLPALADEDADEVGDACDNCLATSNTDQVDLDRDGLGDVCDVCPADPGNVDSDQDTVCNLQDNCVLVENLDQIDDDGDRFGAACDCDDADPLRYPGSPEINDGLDQTCPGEVGFGSIDEVTPDAGFRSAGDKTRFSWDWQTGATSYDVATAGVFAAGDRQPSCWVGRTTNTTSIDDPTVPDAGVLLLYLVRAGTPNAGSWGRQSSGQERQLVICDPGL